MNRTAIYKEWLTACACIMQHAAQSCTGEARAALLEYAAAIIDMLQKDEADEQ